MSSPISVDSPIMKIKLPYSFDSPAASSILSVVYENCSLVLPIVFQLLFFFFFFLFQQYHSSDATLPMSMCVILSICTLFFLCSTSSISCSSSFLFNKNTPIFTSSVPSFSIREKRPDYTVFQELSSEFRKRDTISTEQWKLIFSFFPFYSILHLHGVNVCKLFVLPSILSSWHFGS